MPSLLALLQVSTLALAGLALIATTIWASWAWDMNTAGAVLAVAAVYAGWLSAALWGDEKRWTRRSFAWLWNGLLCNRIRAAVTCVLLLALLGGAGWQASAAYYVPLVIELRIDGRPLPEHCRLSLTTNRRAEPTRIETQAATVLVRLTRNEAAARIAVEAESDSYHGRIESPGNAGTAQLPMTRKAGFDVCVEDSSNPRFSPRGISVAAREFIEGGRNLRAEFWDDPCAALAINGPKQWRITLTTPTAQFTTLLNSVEPTGSSHLDLAAPAIQWQKSDLTTASVRFVSEREIVPRIGRLPATMPMEDADSRFWCLAPAAERLLIRPGFLVSYSDRLKIPRWTAYTLDTSRARIAMARPLTFAPDPELPPDAASSNADYRGSGFDRGNLVSGEDMRYRSEAAYRAAYLLSTACPQAGRMNRTTWYALEEYARAASKRYGAIFILAGTAFVAGTPSSGNEFPLIGVSGVAVPTHLFRILVRSDGDALRALAFLVPNVNDVSADLRPYLTSVRGIESVTELDFFANLPDFVQTELEGTAATELWPVP